MPGGRSSRRTVHAPLRTDDLDDHNLKFGAWTSVYCGHQVLVRTQANIVTDSPCWLHSYMTKSVRSANIAMMLGASGSAQRMETRLATYPLRRIAIGTGSPDYRADQAVFCVAYVTVNWNLVATDSDLCSMTGAGLALTVTLLVLAKNHNSNAPPFCLPTFSRSQPGKEKPIVLASHQSLRNGIHGGPRSWCRVPPFVWGYGRSIETNLSHTKIIN
ncbi:hypothetical protein EDB85DRAFT_2276595 [Lactarius pseudohatsudake]|nr:hypothetical protein EDB85DRAFT_2276595 [Lactarius pseudohatsudake]